MAKMTQRKPRETANCRKCMEPVVYKTKHSQSTDVKTAGVWIPYNLDGTPHECGEETRWENKVMKSRCDNCGRECSMVCKREDGQNICLLCWKD